VDYNVLILRILLFFQIRLNRPYIALLRLSILKNQQILLFLSVILGRIIYGKYYVLKQKKANSNKFSNQFFHVIKLFKRCEINSNYQKKCRKVKKSEHR